MCDSNEAVDVVEWAPAFALKSNIPGADVGMEWADPARDEGLLPYILDPVV